MVKQKSTPKRREERERGKERQEVKERQAEERREKARIRSAANRAKKGEKGKEEHKKYMRQWRKDTGYSEYAGKTEEELETLRARKAGNARDYRSRDKGNLIFLEKNLSFKSDLYFLF